MASGAWNKTTGTRWRMFADAVAFALGVNVWVSVVLLPGLFAGRASTNASVFAATLPLVVLAGGLWRRSEAILLLAFPSALLVPIALTPEIASAHVYGPIRFAIVGLSLVAYLFGVSFFTSFYDPPPPDNARPLSSSRRPVPARWKRRFRVYRALVVLSVAFPIVFVYTLNFDSVSAEYIHRMFPGRVAPMTAVLNVVAIGFWVFLYAFAFLGVLKPHRTGDRGLVDELSRFRVDARRGAPRPLFYVGVVSALTFMLILLLNR